MDVFRSVTRDNIKCRWDILQIARSLSRHLSCETHRITHDVLVVIPAFIRRLRNALYSEVWLCVEHRVQVPVDLFDLLVPLDLRLEKIHFLLSSTYLIL